jgi:hypothetical protein
MRVVDLLTAHECVAEHLSTTVPEFLTRTA